MPRRTLASPTTHAMRTALGVSKTPEVPRAREVPKTRVRLAPVAPTTHPIPPIPWVPKAPKTTMTRAVPRTHARPTIHAAPMTLWAPKAPKRSTTHAVPMTHVRPTIRAAPTLRAPRTPAPPTTLWAPKAPKRSTTHVVPMTHARPTIRAVRPKIRRSRAPRRSHPTAAAREPRATRTSPGSKYRQQTPANPAHQKTRAARDTRRRQILHVGGSHPHRAQRGADRDRWLPGRHRAHHHLRQTRSLRGRRPTHRLR
jgi:hypothetical protein